MQRSTQDLRLEKNQDEDLTSSGERVFIKLPESYSIKLLETNLLMFLRGKDQKLQLTEQAKIWWGEFSQSFSLPNEEALNLLAIDAYGYPHQDRFKEQRNHLFFNEMRMDKSPIAAQAIASFYNQFAIESPLATPTTAMKIKAGVKYLPSPLENKQQSIAAYEQIIAQLHDGVSIESSLQKTPHLAKELIFIEKEIEKNMHVSYDQGELSLHDMLSLLNILAVLRATIDEQALIDLLPKLTVKHNTVEILSSLKDKGAALKLAAQQPKSLLAYWLSFMAQTPTENRPLDFQLDINHLSEREKLKWEMLIEESNIEKVTETIAILECYPQLMQNQTFNNLIHCFGLLTLAPTIWGDVTPRELLDTAKTWLDQTDKNHMSRMLIASMLANPADGIAQNYQVTFKRVAGKGVEWLVHKAIHTREFVNAFTYKPDNTQINVACILYFSPEMKQPVDQAFAQFILSKPAVQWLMDWLYEAYVHENNYRYLNQAKEAYSIPFTLQVDKIRELYIKLISLQTALTKKKQITYEEIFTLLDPLLAFTYAAAGENSAHPIAALRILQETALEKLLADQYDEYLLEGETLTIGEAIEQLALQDEQKPQSIQEALAELLTFINLAAYPEETAYDLLASMARFKDLSGVILKVDEKTQADWLCKAVKNLEVNTVRLLISSGVDVTHVDTNGKTLWQGFIEEHITKKNGNDTDVIAIADLLASAKGFNPFLETDANSIMLSTSIDPAKKIAERTEKTLQSWMKQNIDLNAPNKHKPRTIDRVMDLLESMPFDLFSGRREPRENNIGTTLDNYISQDNPQGFASLVKYGNYDIKNIEQALRFFKHYQELPEIREAEKVLCMQNPQLNFLASLYTFTQEEKQKVGQIIVLNGGVSGVRYLRPEFVGLLFDANNQLLSEAKARPSMDPDAPLVTIYKRGRHHVVSIKLNNNGIVLKSEPDLPGIEYAVEAFNRHLGFHGIAPSHLYSIEDAKGQPYPMLISQYIEGDNLQDILKTNPHLAAHNLKQLDLKRLSELILLSFLVMPEDGKPDNYILSSFIDALGKVSFQLVGIDNDHAFIDAMLVENKKSQLQLKCILFCLDAMLQALDPEVVKEFLTHDPAIFLRNWLLDIENHQKQHNQFQFKDNSSSLFKGASQGTILNMPFNPGTIRTLYEKLVNIQQVLRKHPHISMLDLLCKIMPAVGHIYKQAFNSKVLPKQNPAARFNYVAGNLYEVKDGEYKTLTTNLKIYQTLDIPRTKLNSGLQYGPSEALVLLDAMTREEKFLEKFLMLCQPGQLTSKKLPPFHLLNLVKSREQVLEKLGWERFSIKEQQLLLQGFAQGQFVHLTVKNCAGLTDDLLLKLIANSPNLQKISLINCGALTSKALVTIAKVETLVKLQLIGFEGKAIELGGFTKSTPLSFPNLERLVLTDCNALTTVKLKAEKLNHVRIKNCYSLNNFSLSHLKQIKYLTIMDCVNLPVTQVEDILKNADAFLLVEIDSLLLDFPLIKNIILRDNLWTAHNINYFMIAADTLSLDFKNISDENIAKIIMNAPSLREINLNYNFTLENLILLLKHHPKFSKFSDSLNFREIGDQNLSELIIVDNINVLTCISPFDQIVVGKKDGLIAVCSEGFDGRKLGRSEFYQQEGEVTAICVAPRDGLDYSLISASSNGKIYLHRHSSIRYSSRTEYLPHGSWNTESGFVTALAILDVDSDPYKIVIGTSEGHVIIKDLTKKTEEKMIDNNEESEVQAIISNKNQIICSFKNGKIKTYNIDLLSQQEQTIKRDKTYITAMTRTSTYTIKGDSNGNIEISDLDSQYVITQSAHDAPVKTLVHISQQLSADYDNEDYSEDQAFKPPLSFSADIFASCAANDETKPGDFQIKKWLVLSYDLTLDWRAKLNKNFMLKRSAHALIIQFSASLSDDEVDVIQKGFISVWGVFIDVTIPDENMLFDPRLKRLTLISSDQELITKMYRLSSVLAEGADQPFLNLALNHPVLDEEDKLCLLGNADLPSLEELDNFSYQRMNESSPLVLTDQRNEEHSDLTNDEDIQLNLLKLHQAENLSLEQINDDGKMPLHLACEKGYLKIVRWLHQQGVRFDIETKDKKTASELALENKHYHIVTYLQYADSIKDVSPARKNFVLIRARKNQIAISIRTENAEEPCMSLWRGEAKLLAEINKIKGLTPFINQEQNGNPPDVEIVLHSLNTTAMRECYKKIVEKNKGFVVEGNSGNASNKMDIFSYYIQELLAAGGFFDHFLTPRDKVILPKVKDIIHLVKKVEMLERLFYAEIEPFTAENWQAFKDELLTRAKSGFSEVSTYLHLHCDLFFFYKRKYKDEFSYLIKAMNQILYGEFIDIFSEHSDLEISPASLVTEPRRLGAGGFAAVYKGILKTASGDIPVALKQLNEKAQFDKEIALSGFKREIEIMKHSRGSEYIVKIFGICTKDFPFTIVMELMHASLTKILRDDYENQGLEKSLTLEERGNILYQIAIALSYLHSQDIIHLDLKPDNVLVDGSGKLKLADFGISVRNKQTITTSQGTPGFIACELLLLAAEYLITEAIDMYSFAILMAVVWDSRLAHFPFNPPIKEILAGKRPDIKDDCPELFQQVMKRCWDADPQNRYTAAEVVALLGIYKVVAKRKNDDNIAIEQLEVKKN